MAVEADITEAEVVLILPEGEMIIVVIVEVKAVVAASAVIVEAMVATVEAADMAVTAEDAVAIMKEEAAVVEDMVMTTAVAEVVEGEATEEEEGGKFHFLRYLVLGNCRE